jgi:hypothetical protein
MCNQYHILKPRKTDQCITVVYPKGINNHFTVAHSMVGTNPNLDINNHLYKVLKDLTLEFLDTINLPIKLHPNIQQVGMVLWLNLVSNQLL